MGSGNNITVAIIARVLLCLTMMHPLRAQNSPHDYLDAHNTARAQVGVEPLIWNATLAAFAQNYGNPFLRSANCLSLMQSGGPYMENENLDARSGDFTGRYSRERYGENLGAGSGVFTGRRAVGLWVNEKQYYDYKSNSCARGKVCGHYTQVVWSQSTQVGCARVECYNGAKFVRCTYYPRGNVVGQRPY